MSKKSKDAGHSWVVIPLPKPDKAFRGICELFKELNTKSTKNMTKK